MSPESTTNLSDWCSATAVILPRFRIRLNAILEVPAAHVVERGWNIYEATGSWVQWVPREENVVADALVNYAIDTTR